MDAKKAGAGKKTSLEKLKGKYDKETKKNISTPVPAEHYSRIELSNWKDSEHIVRLLEYISKNKEQGFYIVEVDGGPCLRFSPGLSPDNEKRWQMAVVAEDLFWAAVDDLKMAISKGLIHLQRVSGGGV